jgi:TolB-like protein/class 3 adenylate cyclase/Tfp pilus assembly protein PilF
VAERRASADRGISDRRRGSREAVAPATTRRLAAILAADVAGYSRLMGADEEGTLSRLKAHRRELVDLKIREHHGRIVKTTGDGMLVEFSSVVDALRCAVEVQRSMFDRNAAEPEEKRITFRVGVNLGDVIADGDDIYGDGVNIAARLEALAEPGGICISHAVHDQIIDKLSYAFDDMGEEKVKNIARPLRVYVLAASALAALPAVGAPAQPRAPRRAVTRRRELPRLSIVVLPFANLSNDAEQEYFADGITDDLTTDLSRISGSFVIARTTAFTYKGKPINVKQIGRELGVRYILEGSVRRSGDQVRVNAQLIDAETGAHLWVDQFDTSRANLAQAQSEITGRLAWTLNIALLSDAGRRIEREDAINPDARDLVMRGWAVWYRPQSPKVAEEALQAFERALETDPRSSQARIGIARILVGKLTTGWTSSSLQQDAVQQALGRTERLLFETIESDPNQPMAYAVLGLLRRMQARLSESRIAFEKALSLDPNLEWANHQLGWTLLFLGELEDAIGLGEKSLRLSPRDPNISARYQLLGWCQLLSHRVDKAIDLFTKARTANPGSWFHSLELAGALGLKSDLDGAKAALAESLKFKPEINSLTQWHEYVPWTSKEASPRFWPLQDKTFSEGLRRIGFPEN